MLVKPVVAVNLLQSLLVLREQDDLTARFWVLRVSWSLSDLPTEDQSTIELGRDESSASVRVNATSIVVPNTNHRNGHLPSEVHGDSVVLTRGERSEPHIHVIVGEVVAIDQVLNDARVISIPRQNVDIRRASTDLLHVDLLPIHVVDFDTRQAQVIQITPRRVNIEPQLVARGRLRDTNVLLRGLHNLNSV